MSDKLTWLTVDEASLTEAQKKSLAAYRKVAKDAATARNEFNSLLTTAITAKGKVPADHIVIVGHNFGKLSIAFQHKDAAKAKGTSKPGFSF